MFEPYRSRPRTRSSDPELQDQTGGGLVTPIDYGDVCVDADDAWFAAHHLQVPKTLADLTNPRYKGLLVTENPATSSPGLAFLLRHHREVRRAAAGRRTGRRCKANDVKVANDWDERLQRRVLGRWQGFSAARGVATAPTPPADIIYAADPKPTTPNVSVMNDSCFRQVEYAGVLRRDQAPGGRASGHRLAAVAAVQADVPGCRCSCSRAGGHAPSLRCSRSGRPSRSNPMSLAAGRHHRQPRDVDRRVDRGAASGPSRAGARTPPAWALGLLPAVFLAVFFAWPVLDVLRRG